jgi:ATP/maltotriose-dependent transcriptional regulator MalT
VGVPQRTPCRTPAQPPQWCRRVGRAAGDRKLQLLGLLAAARTNQCIAQELAVSLDTMKESTSAGFWTGSARELGLLS